MSIVKTLQDYLSRFDGIDLVLTDVTAQKDGSFALSPAGGGSVSRDILGGTTYRNSYIFLAREHSRDEVDRQDNYDFLEAFTQWLERMQEIGDLPKLPSPYLSDSIAVSDVMLMDIEEGGAGTYQVQIQFTFKKGVS